MQYESSSCSRPRLFMHYARGQVIINVDRTLKLASDSCGCRRLMCGSAPKDAPERRIVAVTRPRRPGSESIHSSPILDYQLAIVLTQLPMVPTNRHVCY
jgi:hypothetical protein